MPLLFVDKKDICVKGRKQLFVNYLTCQILYIHIHIVIRYKLAAYFNAHINILYIAYSVPLCARVSENITSSMHKYTLPIVLYKSDIIRFLFSLSITCFLSERNRHIKYRFHHDK